MIEVGRLWRCLVLLEVTSMSSVLLSLSLSMFTVAQALTSLIHDSIEWSSSDILSGGADICNYKSSENEWCMIECESIMADKGLIYMVKRIGPRMEPWGTPECTGAKAEQWLVCTISQIRWKPLKDSISKSKVSMETVYKDRMINCVKCWRKVKQG